MPAPQRVQKAPAGQASTQSREIAGKTIERGLAIPERRIPTGPWRQVAEDMIVGDSVGNLARNQANSLRMKLRSLGKASTERSEGGITRVFVTAINQPIPEKKARAPKAVAKSPAPSLDPVDEDEDELDSEDELDEEDE